MQSVLSLNGGADIAAARTRAYELVAAAGAAIARDRTLGGIALRAGIGAVQLSQRQTDKGAQAAVVFGVDIDAFTGR